MQNDGLIQFKEDLARYKSPSLTMLYNCYLEFDTGYNQAARRHCHIIWLMVYVDSRQTYKRVNSATHEEAYYKLNFSIEAEIEKYFKQEVEDYV